MMKNAFSTFLSIAVLGLLTGCGGGEAPSENPPSETPENTGTDNPEAATTKKKKKKVAYVTNGIASFWVIAEAGARAAAKDMGVDVEIRMPPADGAIANQKRMLEELITMRVQGIAVSPIDPANQKDILNMVAEKTNLITHDADAPDSERLAYIGMDNYKAGRMCGKLVKEALPDGGNLMIFVGRLEQLNAKLRRQGLIDELLDRSDDSSRYDEPGKVIGEGGKYVILDTRTDNFDFGAAKALPEDAIAKHPDLDCMVGLFAYNPPYMLEALKGADKIGKVKVVAFDEDEATLQAIKDGHCYGTIVQNPYQYGYQSVKMLSALADGDKSVIPESGFMDIEARAIKQDNVQDFWDELKANVAKGKAAGEG